MKGLLGLTGLAIILAFTTSVTFAQNYKIKQIVSTSGMKSDSTVFVKGPRKRTQGGGMMGVGGDVANIEQCDLKRNIKVSDTKKKYFVTPFPDSTSDTSPTSSRSSQATPGKATKGGTLTITSSIVDTGERKQMFGLTARHVKSSMKMEASPDACNQSNMHIETDGWYVDLPQFSCPLNGTDRTVPYQPPVRSGCQDRTVLKETGGGKLGFPLQSTTTMDGGNGQSFTQSVETIEFSKATLDDALFDIPVGYTLADKEQNLYGAPNYASMMGMAKAMENNEQPSGQPPGNTGSSEKRVGVKRICVIAPTNSSGESFPTENLQSFLVGQLSGQNVDAVAISKESEAKVSSCDYLLTSNFSKMKQSSGGLAGSIMGKITKTDTRTWEAQVDFLLTSVLDGRTVLKNKAVMRAGGGADLAAQNVLAMEASSVLSAAK